MLVNKGTKMHYLFFQLSVQPWSSVHLSVRLSGEKQNKRDFAPWRSNTHFCLNWSHNANETFASENNPPPTTAFVHSGSSLCRNLLQSHADSCFVYQNIDLFSLYTCTSAPLAWSVFLEFSPLPGLPWRAVVFLSSTCHRSARWWQEGQQRDKAVFWEFLCLIGSVGLCVERGSKQLSEWSFSK